MDIEDLIKAIIEIANHEKVIKHLEPNIAFHEKVTEWLAKRILYAYCLLMEVNDDANNSKD